jgi:KUP system potassium uptake protein
MKQMRLTLLALGVVFGDIGTSPLYAVKETVLARARHRAHAREHPRRLSMMFWSLMVVVSLKYVLLIMRADNRGEGGIMALIALSSKAVRDEPRWRGTLTVIGIFGGALFYGDAVLTPAMTMLSAIEGLEVGTQAFTPYVVPIAVGVLVALFALQSQGTETVGRPVRPGHARLVPRHRRRRPARRAARAGGARRAQSAARAALPHHARARSRSWCSARWCWR